MGQNSRNGSKPYYLIKGLKPNGFWEKDIISDHLFLGIGNSREVSSQYIT